jgi:polysaccharide export outer membrane protein
MAQRFYLYVLFILLLSSCNIRQQVMFKTETSRIPAGLAVSVNQAERNYVIQKNDYLEVSLFSNKGERMINLNIENAGTGTNQNLAQQAQPARFLVQDNGFVKLPMVGLVRLEGFTLYKADSLLEKAFTAFYEEPFVSTRFANKRVVVLAPNKGLVIPLTNESMNLIEVIALGGGVSENTRVGNIRLIRGDLKNPEVHLIDLSTIQGMQQANLILQPNDIVYIEPVRRIFRETLAEITPVFSLITSVLTLILVFRSL